MTETEAQLLVWTDVDPEHEADFNAWYDHEHMEERVAIDGFTGAQRYRATSDTARRYLALYRARGLDSFTSEAYKQAFAHQTDWSVRNLGRMRTPSRRVMRVTREVGVGWGSALALVEIAPGTDADPAMDAIAPGDGVLHAQLLVPDADLSSPLPQEVTEGRVLAPIMVVDCASQAKAKQVLAGLEERFSGSLRAAETFSLLWALTERELPPERG